MGKVDGQVRKAESVEEIHEGMILRYIHEDGSVAPFSDVVVTRTYSDSSWQRNKEDPDRYFDVVRPYAFSHLGGELHSCEKLQRLSTRALHNYYIVLLASGKPYTMSLNRTE